MRTATKYGLYNPSNLEAWDTFIGGNFSVTSRRFCDTIDSKIISSFSVTNFSAILFNIMSVLLSEHNKKVLPEEGSEDIIV